MNDALLSFDIRIIMFFQGMGTWPYPFMAFVSATGNGVGVMVVSALLIWGGKAGIGLRSGLVSSLAGAFNGILKISVRQPRPYWVDPRVQGFQFEGEFGMPSGHAMWSAAFMGYIAYAYKRLRYLLLAIVVILLVGFSRIYLGVHSPTQVLAGWGASAFILALFLVLEQPAARLVEKLSTVRLVSALFVFSILVVASGILIIGARPEFTIPELWVTNAGVFSDRPLAPMALDTIIQSIGIFFGMASGALLWNRRKTEPELGETVPPQAPVLAVILKRYLAGFAGVVPLGAMFAASSLFLGTIPWLQEVILFILFSLTGLWITLGAPLLFRRLSLALHGEQPY